MRKVIFTGFIFLQLIFFPLHAKDLLADSGEKAWYKVETLESANPIYVDYRTLRKENNIVRYEQLEFLKSKQKIDESDKQYQFIVSKMQADCINKKYFIKEQKFFDSNVNPETGEISEKMVHKINNKDNETMVWSDVVPDSPLQRVIKFVCMYKHSDN